MCVQPQTIPTSLCTARLIMHSHYVVGSTCSCWLLPLLSFHTCCYPCHSFTRPTTGERQSIPGPVAVIHTHNCPAHMLVVQRRLSRYWFVFRGVVLTPGVAWGAVRCDVAWRGVCCSGEVQYIWVQSRVDAGSRTCFFQQELCG